MGQANSAEEHKLVSSFEAVRNTLLQEEFADRLEKPLAYWALPNDRRLPLAFLGRSLGELLNTPFHELTATRGIGHKKISSLVKLLHRATSSAAPAVPYGLQDLADELEAGAEPASPAEPASNFDPALVSEALWVTWCETVVRFHLENEPLGRLAASLQSLPTVIWRTPLAEYVNRSLADIRQLKTHGEKRVRVVLEVFHSVHELLANANSSNHLAIRLMPRFVPAAEAYIDRVSRDGDTAIKRDAVNHVLEPILRQIEIDSGDTVAGLTRHRLGIGAEQRSVRDLAKDMGVTRARVYQLLEDAGKVMEVRWPDGRKQLQRLHELADDEAKPTIALAKQLFFADKDEMAEEREPEAVAG